MNVTSSKTNKRCYGIRRPILTHHKQPITHLHHLTRLPPPLLTLLQNSQHPLKNFNNLAKPSQNHKNPCMFQEYIPYGQGQGWFSGKQRLC